MVHHLPLIRVLAAAIVLVAVACLPSLASAHAGHSHAAPATSQQNAHPSGAVRVAAHRVQDAFVSETHSYKSIPNSSQGIPCDLGCCSGAFCTACCAIVAPETPGVSLPTPKRVFEFADIACAAGLKPDGPRRPPKSFA
jgi:hypothetical protein